AGPNHAPPPTRLLLRLPAPPARAGRGTPGSPVCSASDTPPRACGRSAPRPPHRGPCRAVPALPRSSGARSGGDAVLLPHAPHRAHVPAGPGGNLLVKGRAQQLQLPGGPGAGLPRPLEVAPQVQLQGRPPATLDLLGREALAPQAGDDLLRDRLPQPARPLG